MQFDPPGEKRAVPLSAENAPTLVGSPVMHLQQDEEPSDPPQRETSSVGESTPSQTMIEPSDPPQHETSSVGESTPSQTMISAQDDVEMQLDPNEEEPTTTTSSGFEHKDGAMVVEGTTEKTDPKQALAVKGTPSSEKAGSTASCSCSRRTKISLVLVGVFLLAAIAVFSVGVARTARR